jgi:hypothetical protein
MGWSGQSFRQPGFRVSDGVIKIPLHESYGFREVGSFQMRLKEEGSL